MDRLHALFTNAFAALTLQASAPLAPLRSNSQGTVKNGRNAAKRKARAEAVALKGCKGGWKKALRTKAAA